MPMLFDDLREHLLRAGIAPRHVRRYLAELRDHLADLRADADEATALSRLGTLHDLAKPMLDRPELRSWITRAPWAAMVLGPILLMAAASLTVILALGVVVQFLRTPIEPHPHIPAALQFLFTTTADGVQFILPVLIGWSLAVIAYQRRMRPLWPTIGLVLLSLISGSFDFGFTFATEPGHTSDIHAGFGLAFPPGDLSKYALHGPINLALILGPYLYCLPRPRWWRERPRFIDWA